MITLRKYIKIMEGGTAGHMAHPFDYTDFTGQDLVDLIDSLFSGKVEHMKEKLDGMQLSATKNPQGDVVFIRNGSDLNSRRGGMTIEELRDKYADREHQRKVYTMAGETISEIFTKVPTDYFVIDDETRKVINCECIIAGKTNIMPYAQDRVAFHGYKTYKRGVNKKGIETWIEAGDTEGDVDEIYRAAEGIDKARPRPDLVIKSATEAAKAGEKFRVMASKMFDDEGLSLTSTVEDWKRTRYKKLAPEWMRDSDALCARVCDDDKSVNLQKIKKSMPEHAEELKDIDAIKDKLIKDIMAPIDRLFLSIGNEFIDMLDGFTNSGAHDEVVSQLRSDMQDIMKQVKDSGSQEVQDKVMKQLDRLKDLGDKYNSAEGIVFTYKGRRMKLTGSFAPINKILGTRYNIK